jgi:hypothetical protein
MRRLLHNIITRLIYFLYGDDSDFFYAGELASKIEADLFTDGEILEVIEIYPEDDGYNIQITTKDDKVYI